jgi:hypothetical protein
MLIVDMLIFLLIRIYINKITLTVSHRHRLAWEK